MQLRPTLMKRGLERTDPLISEPPTATGGRVCGFNAQQVAAS